MDIEVFHQILQEQCRLTPGLPLLVGVSGGADSICLLEMLAQSPYPVIVAHYNHQLRPESGEDEAAAQTAAERLGVPFRAGGADVAAWARAEKRSIEDAARTLRYRFLFQQARDSGAQAVAVGHTADDQVETVLMHLLQGAGLAGLAGMSYRDLSPWEAAIPLVRPLLGIWRQQTVAFCQERGLPFVTDRSNLDRAYTRNRVRLELIPFLEQYNPSVRRALWRMAKVLAGEEEIVQEAVQSAWLDCLVTESETCVTFKLEPLRRMGRPLQRAVLRRAAARLLRGGPALRQVAFDDLERAAGLLSSPPRGAPVDFAAGLRLVFEPGRDGQDRLLVLGPGQSEKDLDVGPQVAPGREASLSVPGEVALGGGWVLSAVRADIDAGTVRLDGSRWEAWLDAGALSGPLTVRAARPGERFQPLGMGGRSVKLSDFWINEKHPRRARAGWPLVLCGGVVAWVPGFRPTEPFRVTDQTRRVLHLRLAVIGKTGK